MDFVVAMMLDLSQAVTSVQVRKIFNSVLRHILITSLLQRVRVRGV